MALKVVLHPDDERELFHLRRELLGWHHATGDTQRDMAARVGRSPNFIYDLEGGKSMPLLSSLQQWARCFDLRLEPKVTAWGMLEPQKSAMDEYLMLVQMSRPFESDRWVRLQLVSKLVLVRHRMGLSAQDVAGKMGVTKSSVQTWERTAHDPLVGKVFDYARAVGGRLTFTLWERGPYENRVTSDR